MVFHPVMLHAANQDAARVRAENWWAEELAAAESSKTSGQRAAATRKAKAEAKKTTAPAPEIEDEDDGEAL